MEVRKEILNKLKVDHLFEFLQNLKDWLEF
jgi:hypothetical protein